MKGTALLQLQEVSRWFNRHQPTEVLAVDRFNLQVEAGDYVVVVGANGSGKSTLLNLIAGSLLPDSGTILIGGNNVTRLPDYRRSRFIARIFQDPLQGTAPDLTLLDNFRLSYLRARPKMLRLGITRDFRTKVKHHVSELKLGLEDQLDKEVRMFSGGQRQAISLLMATLAPPQLLLMDEPTAALDPRTSEEVMQLAHQLISRQQLTTLMVTHNLRHALHYGNRLVIMRSGSIAAQFAGTGKQQLTLSELQQWFY